MENLHLCIITGQPLANLIPLLQEQEKPEIIVLIHSSDKVRDAGSFEYTLKEAGFDQSQIHKKSDLPTHDFESIRSYALKMINDLKSRFPGSQITLNVTGGTKQMALAFWNVLVLDKNEIRVIYCDTRNGILEELIPDNRAIKLEPCLTPELYLCALGKIKRKAESDEPDWQDKAEKRKKLTKYFGDKANDLERLFQQFNQQLKGEADGLRSLTLNTYGAVYNKEAIEFLLDYEVLDRIGGNRYTLLREDGVKYLSGAWLEEYVWHIAKDQQVDHVEIGLKFGDREHRRRGQDNEIDGFIIHRNRLLLIECKSGWMGTNKDKDAQVIYKLDSIGLHAGGTQATRLLVSAQALRHTTRAGRDVDTRVRAKATDISTLEAADLKKLRQRIRYWMEHGNWESETA